MNIISGGPIDFVPMTKDDGQFDRDMERIVFEMYRSFGISEEDLKVTQDPNDKTTFHIQARLPAPPTWIEINISIPGDVCECGSEKVGSPIHSSWCPKGTK